MQLSTSFLVSAVTLGLAGLTGAICSGNTLGVGTAAASGANTQCKCVLATDVHRRINFSPHPSGHRYEKNKKIKK